MNIPISIFVFSLMTIAVIGVFIGSWIRGLGSSDYEREMNDMILLYKTRWEQTEKHLKALPLSTELRDIERDLYHEYVLAPSRTNNTPDYIDGLRAGLKMAMLLVRPKI